MVHAIKMGWMKPPTEKKEGEEEEEKEEDMTYYDLWKDDNEVTIYIMVLTHISLHIILPYPAGLKQDFKLNFFFLIRQYNINIFYKIIFFKCRTR